MTALLMKSNYRTSLVGLLLAVSFMLPEAQAQNGPSPTASPQSQSAAPVIRPNYVLGVNDQLLIRAPQAAEINERPFRVDADGFITLPLVGRVRAGGTTVQDLEAELVKRLREYIREPQVIVTVVQFHSEPVFLVGAFRNPGIYPLEGKTLVEIMAAAGGLQPNASRRIKVTRRNEYGVIPLTTAIEDHEKKVSTVEIGIASLSDNINPGEDIILRPYDIITVERAELIYVSGDITKAGGLELGERDSIGVTQAIAMAGGFTPRRHRGRVRILRPILDTNRRAVIEVDVKRIYEAKDGDFPLLPNDGLCIVPRSTGRTFLIGIGTSLITSLRRYQTYYGAASAVGALIMRAEVPLGYTERSL